MNEKFLPDASCLSEILNLCITVWNSQQSFFFFRLFESLCSNDSPAQFGLHPPYDDDDEEGRSILSSVVSLAGSRTSSQCSLVKDVAADGDDDETVSLRKVVFVIINK